MQTTNENKFINSIKTYFSKPQNIILFIFGILLTFTTLAPIVAIVEDTIKIHPGTLDAYLSGKVSGYSIVNYIDIFNSICSEQGTKNTLDPERPNVIQIARFDPAKGIPDVIDFSTLRLASLLTRVQMYTDYYRSVKLQDKLL